MLQLPASLARLCKRHRISTDLPTQLFIERCVDALQIEGRNLEEVTKSTAFGIAAQSRYMPNPGIVRSEKIAAFDSATDPQSAPDNSCLDSAFPWLME